MDGQLLGRGVYFDDIDISWLAVTYWWQRGFVLGNTTKLIVKRGVYRAVLVHPDPGGGVAAGGYGVDISARRGGTLRIV